MSHQILSEFGRLLFTRPGPDASPEAVGDWYLRKARLFEHVAASGGADAADALRQAELARGRARRLTGERVA
jgi:hypothetical protein